MKTGKKENTKSEIANKKRVERNIDELERVISKKDLALLTDRQKEIVQMRISPKRMKIEDIAKKEKVTKQYISWVIHCAISRIIRKKNN